MTIVEQHRINDLVPGFVLTSSVLKRKLFFVYLSYCVDSLHFTIKSDFKTQNRELLNVIVLSQRAAY